MTNTSQILYTQKQSSFSRIAILILNFIWDLCFGIWNFNKAKLVSRSFVIIITAFSIAQAQDVSVTATIDSQSVVIGDWIRYSVVVKYPSGIQVAFPSYKDTLDKFDIVQQDSLFKTEENNVVELKKNFVLTKFDAGNHYIPPFTVQFRDSTGKIQIAQSNPIPVEVRGVEVDTTQAIRDVKPQMSVPLSMEEIALYIGIVLVLAGAGYSIYYFLQKKKKNISVEEEEKPDIPPHVLALLQLDELEEKQLWQKGENKIFYSEATEIVRRYFELRYGIMALEMTTREVMDQLKKFTIEKTTFISIERFLSDADFVKFAKYQPGIKENEEVIPDARKIVEKTKPTNEIDSLDHSKEEVQSNV